MTDNAAFIIYLLESSACMIIFYLFYRLVLAGQTFFMMNRAYLIATAILSLIIPLFSIDISSANQAIGYYMLNPIVVTAGSGLESAISNLSFTDIILIVYLTGASLFMIRFIYQIFQLITIVRKFGISRNYGINIILTDNSLSPFSFFNMVFLDKSHLSPEEFNHIIEHEKMHIRQKHTIDLLLLELFGIFQWFNPFVRLYIKSIKEIHEHLADREVIRNGANLKSYMELIMKRSGGVRFFEMANNFNFLTIKRRIKMIGSAKPPKISFFRFVLLLPVVSGLLLVFACTDKENITPVEKVESISITTEDKAPETTEKNEGTVTKADEINIKTSAEKKGNYIVVDSEPEVDLTQLQKSIKYPEEARKKGIQGKVLVKVMVDKNGKPSKAEIISSDNQIFNESAVNAIMSCTYKPAEQKGKKVAAYINVPLHFRLR